MTRRALLARALDDAAVIERSLSGIVHVLALTTCLLSIGCPRTTEPVTTPPLLASDTVVVPPESEPAPAPEPARPFEITYYVDHTLWQIDPDGTDARSLGYDVPSDAVDSGSRVGGGTTSPRSRATGSGWRA